MTQAWPYLAAGSLKGLELKFEMIEREGGRKKTVTGMFIGCSWASLEQYGPGLNAGSVCVSLCIHMCMHVGVFIRGCVWGERSEILVNMDQSLDISRYMCLCRGWVWKINTCMQAPESVRVCVHAGMCVSDRDIRAIWKSLSRKYGAETCVCVCEWRV